MNILIVGLGYVGKAAAVRFKSRGFRVIGTTRDPEKKAALAPIVDEILLWDDALKCDFLEGIDNVLLCAAPDSLKEYQSTYLKNAEKIVAAAERSTTMKQILYTGSISVYGDQKGAIVTEETAIHPLNPQAEILAQTESCFLQQTASPACILRLGEIIGPGRSLEERVAKMQGKAFPGTGDNPVNLSPLADILNGLEFAIENELRGVFNLVSDYHPPRNWLYTEIAKKCGLPPPVWDPTLISQHGGNRIVSSKRLLDLQFSFETNAVL